MKRLLALFTRRRRQLEAELRDEVHKLIEAQWNRNNLIAKQDDEITRLRNVIKELEADRDYWQGKAANP